MSIRQDNGEPILILPGWGGRTRSWETCRQLLNKEGNDVFILAFPGFGEAPDPPYPWTVKDYADWVLNFANEENLEKFFLLGHSFGGRVAIKFATLYPERLISLILVDTAGVEREKSLSLRQKLISKLLKFKHFIVSFPFFGKLFYPFLQRLSYFLAGTRDYYLIKSSVMKETFKRIIEEDLTLCLSQIPVPTLIIWGERDKMVPLKNAYIIRGKIPNSTLEILPKIGHNPHLEAPEILAEKILNFID